MGFDIIVFTFIFLLAGIWAGITIYKDKKEYEKIDAHHQQVIYQTIKKLNRLKKYEKVHRNIRKKKTPYGAYGRKS
jgi:hypothetical protein